MPASADVKALAIDPPGRFDALPDSIVDKMIAVASRWYADMGEDPVEQADVVAYHVAHLLALAGVGAPKGGGVGPVASQSVSMTGASTTWAVAAVQPGAVLPPLDARTIYGIMALAIRDGVPTIDVGGPS